MLSKWLELCNNYFQYLRQDVDSLLSVEDGPDFKKNGVLFKFREPNRIP